MWRSLLFVPMLNERLHAKAADRGADALVLDLEASVAAERKEEARAALPAVVDAFSSRATVTVRVNPAWLPMVRDLSVCARSGVTAIHLAQCESPAEVLAADGVLTELERERGLPERGIGLIAMLESAGAVRRAEAIASAAPRVRALTLGVEDYATSMGVEASGVVLRPAAYDVIQAARATGRDAYVVPAAMTDFRDTDTLKQAALDARAQGSVGGYAVHPTQVSTLNAAFSPRQGEIDWANRVTDAAREAQAAGLGVILVDGKMIDAPLITRAHAILRLAEEREPSSLTENEPKAPTA